MVHTTTPTEKNTFDDVYELLHNVSGDVMPFGSLFDLLKRVLPFAEGVIVSSLPRGGLHIVQPPTLSEGLTRAYGRDLEAHDRLSWQVIAQQRPLRAADAWAGGELEANRYYRDFMQANNFAYAAAAPLSAPVLEGYAGALHLYRDASQGDFSDEELQKLGEVAGLLDQAIARIRSARSGEACANEPLPHRPPSRQFLFDANLESPVPQGDPSVLDERLRENIVNDARRRFDHVNGREVVSDRVSFPDARGDLWNFRVITRRTYPALSSGPVVFYCLQPACCDWGTLRPEDFQADPELARLLPALKFMADEFHRGPTLVEIARTVHLSPFHFHRRFTELLGITPKHFLLDCQIEQAKSELVAREKDLAKIATQCGFAHQSHFTSRFKQATGLTPTRWRRMAAEAQRVSTN
jgi:AraC-like DNA-binding protein